MTKKAFIQISCWAITLTSIALAKEIPGISTSDSHFCLLAQGKIQCFNSDGEVKLPSEFLYPIASYGGGNNQCVYDYNGLHCWNWGTGKVLTYSEFQRVSDLQVSKNFLCGRNEKSAWQCVLAPESSLSSPPFLPKEELRNTEEVLVLDDWFCVAQPERPAETIGSTVVECYHPNRSFTDPLVLKWQYPAKEFEKKGNTFAALYEGGIRLSKSAVENIVATALWNLPEDGEKTEYKGAAWNRLSFKERFNQNILPLVGFDPRNHHPRKLHLVGQNDLFMVGERQRVAGSVERPFIIDLLEKDSEGRPRSWTTTRLEPVLVEDIVGGFLTLSPNSTDPMKWGENYGEMQNWGTTFELLFYINDKFVCLGNEEESEGKGQFKRVKSISCGKPSAGGNFLLGKFEIEEVPFHGQLGGSFEVYGQTEWQQYTRNFEKLPSDRAQFATEFVRSVKKVDFVTNFILRDILQTVLENTDSAYFKELAWREGMNLTASKKNLPVPATLPTSMREELMYSKSRLGTKEEIKRDPWRKAVLNKIDLYLK